MKIFQYLFNKKDSIPISKTKGNTQLIWTLNKISNKKKKDYISKGVKCVIIEVETPSFIWNIDEKKIQNYLGYKGKIKLGNRYVRVQTYTELSEKDIELINENYGIAIMTSHESIGKSKNKYYRFGILENGLSEIRSNKINEILETKTLI